MDITKKRLLSKKELRQILSSDNLPLSNYMFRKCFFTDEFITNTLKLSVERYNKLKFFNIEQTMLIKQFFQFGIDDV